MKFIKNFLIVICLFSIFDLRVGANTIPTLEQISTKFNNNSEIKKYAESNVVLKSSVNDDKLIITTTNNNTTNEYKYTLDGNILSTIFQQDELFMGVILTHIVVDSVEQFHGYSEGELNSTLNSDKVFEYTLDDEGLEMVQISSGGLSVKIDISKKIPCLDFSNTYIEVEDLADYKDYISGNGSAEFSKGNIWFNKSGYYGDNTVLIAEKNNLTNNSYKSLLSIIQVMFDSSEAVDYFKKNYPELFLDKEFSGFKIELNPVKTNWEQKLIPDNSGYEFIRVTINNSEVINSLFIENNDINDDDSFNKTTVDTKNASGDSEKNKVSENSENDYKSSSTVKQENTGVNSNYIVFCIAILLSFMVIISFKRKNMFKKI